MDIRDSFDKKSNLEAQLCSINQPIKDRWEKLIGFGCGYFDDWTLGSNNKIVVYYTWRGDRGNDSIPLEFFEIEDTQDAIVLYKEFLQKCKDETFKLNQLELERQEKEQYEFLKKKFKGV